jgi:hypothetical protein
VGLGYFGIQALPTNNVIGGFRNKGTVSGTPPFVVLQHFFYDLIGIFPFIKDHVEGINYGKN